VIRKTAPVFSCALSVSCAGRNDRGDLKQQVTVRPLERFCFRHLSGATRSRF
jgi:hypothetical protein